MKLVLNTGCMVGSVGEKMNIYNNVLNFKGTWRTYQQRILDKAEMYLSDRKIHIVAAPGSGKTTLGIELIRRQGNPCLVLSPSITIREQWLSRVKEGFMIEGINPDEWLSNNIKNSKPITAITYQALHSCMKQFVGVLDESEEGTEENEKETVDFSGFDIYKEIKKAGIKTICLDEAHHLRSEWWKALEEFIKNVPEVTIISLTATPPYDSTPAQWKRYIDLCGTIDEEIFTPELVKEGSLCPHQDYIYFNLPTEEEKQAVKEHTKQAQNIYLELKEDKVFIDAISTHIGLKQPEEYSERFLDNPKYFFSLLVFLKEAGVPFSPYLMKLTGTKEKLPRLSKLWLETLLQGFLYEDVESYLCDEAYREELITKLKSVGCIQRKKVRLAWNDEVSKLLMASKGKLNSINDIVKAEYDGMGEDLRMLVLCDYIKKDYLTAVGNPEKPVNELGAIPIFENIRRQNIPGIRLGVLTGSIVIVPSDAEEEMASLLVEYDCEGKMSPLGDTGYCKVDVKGTGHHIVSVITELFTRGKFNTLVGTKSLLGEGWDSPCINSLILATYVGSFMLSNQMRGRAIRVFKDQPDKTSNIWHLACILPQSAAETSEERETGDYETLKRRFDAFLGISFSEDVIESGIQRMDIGRLNNKKDVELSNNKMMNKAKDRTALREAWNNSLQVIYENMSVEEVEEVDKSLLEPGYYFLNAFSYWVGSVIILMLWILTRESMLVGISLAEPKGILVSIVSTGLIILMFKYGYRVLMLMTPQKRMKQMARGILRALIEAGKLEEPYHCRVEVEEIDIAMHAYLKGGSTRDKTLFARCLAEFFGMIDNPRYLLVRTKGFKKREDCYTVPEVFGKNKEDAIMFAHYMKKSIGPYEAVYTRTPEGRKVLLEARTKSFVNKNDRLINGKKKLY